LAFANTLAERLKVSLIIYLRRLKLTYRTISSFRGISRVTIETGLDLVGTSMLLPDERLPLTILPSLVRLSVLLNGSGATESVESDLAKTLP
jgi:hypothetical protein